MIRKRLFVAVLAWLATILAGTLPFAAQAVENIHTQVDELMLKGDFAAAIELASRTYEKSADDPVVICALACSYRNSAIRSGIYYASPNRERAIELYHENIRKNPTYENSYFNLMNMFWTRMTPSK